MASPLPIPSDEWLRAFNEECRAAGIPADARPFRAFERWARERGQTGPAFDGLLSQLASPAFKAIDAFFRAHTSLGRDRSSPIYQTCFFYDSSFWQVVVPVMYGHHVFDPIQFVSGMPPALFRDLGLDSRARNELDEHCFDCLHHLNNVRMIDDESLPELARDFLGGAEKALRSSVASLLAVPPNAKAAETARDAFESALKGFAVVKTGLTSQNAAKAIGHNLADLVRRCAPHLPRSEVARLQAASALYPAVSARYSKAAIARELLWQCYREAQHAFSVAIRIISGDPIS